MAKSSRRSASRQIAVVLTCEHGGADVPPQYRHLFAGHEEVLKTHRGLDIGVLPLVKAFGAALGIAPIYSTTTRLLVELNRSIWHSNLFSQYSKVLSDEEKQTVLATYYHPYRDLVHSTISQHIQRGKRVVHLSVHTFTPVLKGKVRRADIGLLYNPRRLLEKEFCARWKERLNAEDPNLAVYCNEPYMGISDALTTALRHVFPAKNYLGLELEVNQAWPLRGGRDWTALKKVLTKTFSEGV